MVNLLKRERHVDSKNWRERKMVEEEKEIAGGELVVHHTPFFEEGAMI